MTSGYGRSVKAQRGPRGGTGAPASAAKVFRKELELSPEHREVLQELCLVQIDPPQRKKKGLLGRLRGE